MKLDKDDKDDRDSLVIKALVKAGSDLSKPHNVDFTFHFDTVKGATRFGRKIEKDGFKFEMHKNDDGTMVIEAQKNLMLSVELMREIRIKLNLLAQKNDGDYDGWGTMIV